MYEKRLNFSKAPDNCVVQCSITILQTLYSISIFLVSVNEMERLIYANFK